MPVLGAMKKYWLQGKFFTYITLAKGMGDCSIFKGMILQNEFNPEMGHMYLGDLDAKICEHYLRCFEN